MVNQNKPPIPPPIRIIKEHSKSEEILVWVLYSLFCIGTILYAIYEMYPAVIKLFYGR